MSRWRKAAGVVAVLAAFGLSGCASNIQDKQTYGGDAESGAQYWDGYLKTRKGEKFCVFYDRGLSCDWSNTK